MNELIKNVILWANERNVLKDEYKFQQFTKFCEELGEFENAMGVSVKDPRNIEDVVDGAGDVQVTLIILTQQLGITIEECYSQMHEKPFVVPIVELVGLLASAIIKTNYEVIFNCIKGILLYVEYEMSKIYIPFSLKDCLEVAWVVS